MLPVRAERAIPAMPGPRQPKPAPGPAKGRRSSLLDVAPNFDHLNRLFSAIYDGPLEPTPWHTALQLLRDTLDAQHVTLILRPPSPQSTGVMVNTDTVVAEATQSYQTHFFALDPFVGLPDGQIVTPEEVLGRGWMQSAFYEEYMRPLNLGPLIGSDIHTPQGVECRFRVARPGGAPPFSDEDKALCRFLLPHLRRALQLHTRLDDLECERQFFAGVVNRLQLGLICYAADGTIVDVNAEARRILAQKDGIALGGGSLALDSQQESREFRQLLREALGGSQAETPALVAAMSVTRPSGESKLGLMVRTVPPGPWTGSGQRPAAVVYLRDPTAGSAQTSHEVVQRIFNLGQMEAKLAAQLAEGFTLEEAAERLGITKNTARTYLRYIFAKTGVSRQSMLIRRVINSVASLN